MMHIYNRVRFDDSIKISDLLDLENDISDDLRGMHLKQILADKLSYEMKPINTEQDILAYLKKRSFLNDIPLIVKKHFGLE